MIRPHDTLVTTRKASGLTQNQLAHYLKLTPPIYACKEKGIRCFSDAELYRLSQLFHVSTVALFPELMYWP